MLNRRWVLAAHPRGPADENTWRIVSSDLPSPAAGQILVRTQWLSLDPYMRGRLGTGAGMQVGDLMQGGGVGEVIESRHADWKIGDIVETLEMGWQEYSILTPDSLAGPTEVHRVDTDLAPPQASLSWRGMTGLTAYFAMLEIACPKPGDVVVVSAASGAVGQIAGQIAKMMGCCVIGIAGSKEKLAWCLAIGFDKAINYRDCHDLSQAIRHAAPNGVNVFFDATGGAVHDAVISNLALKARVAIVGRIANPAGEEDIGLRSSALLIASRAKLQGFVVYDWWHRRDEALHRLDRWHAEGILKFREDITQGFDKVPHAYVRMMRGENIGKQLVQI